MSLKLFSPHLMNYGLWIKIKHYKSTVPGSIRSTLLLLVPFCSKLAALIAETKLDVFAFIVFLRRRFEANMARMMKNEHIAMVMNGKIA